MRDYYQILGISRTATEADIKKAFRTAASKTHPDKEGGTEAAFKEVYEAYDTLKDSTRRRRYDEYLNNYSQYRSQSQSQSSSSHSGKSESTNANAAKAQSDYSKQESIRHDSFIYKVRYGVAFTFYVIERSIQSVKDILHFIFRVISQVIVHAIHLVYMVGAFLIAGLIVAVIISLLSLFGIVFDPEKNVLRAATFCASIGFSAAIAFGVVMYQEDDSLFLFRKKIPKKAIVTINRGLLAGALATTASYLFQWSPMGMDLISMYIVGFVIGVALRLLYNWSRGVDSRFDK